MSSYGPLSTLVSFSLWKLEALVWSCHLLCAFYRDLVVLVTGEGRRTHSLKSSTYTSACSPHVIDGALLSIKRAGLRLWILVLAILPKCSLCLILYCNDNKWRTCTKYFLHHVKLLENYELWLIKFIFSKSLQRTHICLHLFSDRYLGRYLGRSLMRESSKPVVYILMPISGWWLRGTQ